MRRYSLALLCLWASSAQAQRLLWETTYNANNINSNAFISFSLTPARQILVTGCGGNTGTGREAYQAVFRSYDLTGALLRSRLGRGISTGDQALCAGAPGRYWWVGNGARYGVTNTPSYVFVQRLTARGDTLPGGPVPTPAPPAHYGFAVLAAGRHILVAGTQDSNGAGGQNARYTLTAIDTATWAVRWRYVYNRPNFANDIPIGLVRTPRGGYLLTGDGQVLNSTRQHLLLETDSLGRQLKQRLIYPLGPTFIGSSAARKQSDIISNIIALPNAQGYLTTGVADSLSNNGTIHHHRAYLMRLDTALNVTWVYRNPPDLFGTGNGSQRVNKVRLLGDGTAAYLVRDLRGVGTPDLYVVRVDLATGRRRSVTLLQSNTQSAVIPFDWDLVGDGTLVVCGKSQQLGTAVSLGWLARFDVRGTPLATGQPQKETTETATFTLFPNPATGPLTLTWQLPPAARAGQLRLYSVLGQLVKTLPLPPTASGRLAVAGLPPGIYLARLLDAAGAGQGRAQRLLVRE